MAGRSIVIVPTYLEADNIERLLRTLREHNPDVDVLVVDDSSADGTADIARTVGEELGGVDVSVRATKSGLGAAYRHGMRVALDRGYEVIGQMDADLSHDPAALPTLRARLDEGYGLVIGSRYVAGGSIPNWSRRRRLLSQWGNRYTRWVLGLDVADATAGYRLWTADAIGRCGVLENSSRGYLFQIENAYRARRGGVRLAEVPISFSDREHGRSKMSGAVIVEALGEATWWGFRDRILRRGRTNPGQ
jgi:dolichol-phosphate mannosyltransferase